MTGEPFSYANWAAGEPNNSLGRGEFWVEMFGDGTWNDNVEFDQFPTNGYVVEYPTPVTGSLTFNSVSNPVGTVDPAPRNRSRSRWTWAAPRTSLSIDGVAVQGAQNVSFPATSLNQVNVEFGTTGTQRFAWDNVRVSDGASTTLFDADFSGDVVGQSPGAPAAGTWTISNLNGSVLVQAASGSLVNTPVELRQFGGTNGVSLQGNVANPPTAGVWTITWTSVMTDPGPGGFYFVPIVIRGNGGIIASIEYR